MVRRITVGAAVAAVVALLALAGCGGSDAPPSGVTVKTAHLFQDGPGQTPVIRMGWAQSTFPDPASIVAWLVYRGTNFGVAAEDRNLIDVVDSGGALLYEDLATATPEVTFSRGFAYVRRGEQQQGSIEITYDRPAVVPGERYYYRARRVVAPNSGGIPIAQSAQASSVTVDPADAIGSASSPQGPVTYFLPPSPTQPSNGSQAVDGRRIPFTWQTSTGADTYQIRVYSQPDATGQPVVQTPEIRPLGSLGSFTYGPGPGTPLQGATSYYWVVGARVLAETTPTSGSESGWLKSAVQQFTTASLPPPIP